MKTHQCLLSHHVITSHCYHTVSTFLLNFFAAFITVNEYPVPEITVNFTERKYLYNLHLDTLYLDLNT